MKKSNKLTNEFYAQLKKQFQTRDLPTEKVQVDWDTIQVLDVDLRAIKNPELVNPDEKRLVVLIGKDKATKETVVIKQELCGFDCEPRKVIRQALGKLMELGYKMEKAKTMIRFYLDFHNPVDPTPECVLHGTIF